MSRRELRPVQHPRWRALKRPLRSRQVKTDLGQTLFEIFSQRYEQASTLVTSNLPFNEWTEIFGSERLTGALLDRLTHHVHILELNGDSYRLEHSKKARPHAASPAP